MTNKKTLFSRFLNESRALLVLSMPIIISQLAAQAMNFVDTTMAGQASARDLAAIAVAGSLWMPVSLLLRGILMALTPTIAHHRGAGMTREITRDLGQTFWIALFCSAILIAYLSAAESILVYMNVAPDIIPIASGYLTALCFGVPGIAFFYTLNSFCEGMSNTRAPMIIAIAGLLINIPVNYILIHGKLGLPALGAVGCGWATSLVYWLMSALMMIYLKSRHLYSNLVTTREMKLLPQRIMDMLKLGLPIGINIFVCGSIFAVIALLIGKLGTTSVASHQIALNFSGLTYMIPMSLSFGITIRVGHILGQGNQEEARLRSISGILLAVTFAAISATCLLLFPDAIIGLYTNDPAVAQSAALLLVYAAVYQISDALQASSNGVLRGYKDTQVPMILVTIAYWVVALPFGYTLGLTDKLVPAMGPAGFWIGLITGLTLAAVLLGGRLLMVMHKQRTNLAPTMA